MQDKLVHVLEVDVLGDHRLRLTFEDGLAGEIEFDKREWKGVLTPLRNPAFFAQVTVDPALGTLVWPGGLDIAPEPLYEEVVQQNVSQAARA